MSKSKSVRISGNTSERFLTNLHEYVEFVQEQDGNRESNVTGSRVHLGKLLIDRLLHNQENNISSNEVQNVESVISGLSQRYDKNKSTIPRTSVHMRTSYDDAISAGMDMSLNTNSTDNTSNVNNVNNNSPEEVVAYHPSGVPVRTILPSVQRRPNSGNSSNANSNMNHPSQIDAIYSPQPNHTNTRRKITSRTPIHTPVSDSNPNNNNNSTNTNNPPPPSYTPTNSYSIPSNPNTPSKRDTTHTSTPVNSNPNITNNNNDPHIQDAISRLRQAVEPATSNTITAKPKYIKKPSFQGNTNKKLIINAIQYLCLAGGSHEQTRNDALQTLTTTDHNHFVVLLKQTTTLKYSGIYLCDLSTGILVKIAGDGPDAIVEKQVNQCYKYDSAGKQWVQLPSNKLTLTTDAITYKNKYTNTPHTEEHLINN